MYDEVDFERRFRVPLSVFLRIYHTVKGRPFFAQRINATGRPQAHPLRKVVAAFRVIAYGETCGINNVSSITSVLRPTVAKQ